MRLAAYGTEIVVLSIIPVQMRAGKSVQRSAIMPKNKMNPGKQGSDANPQNQQYNNPQQSGQQSSQQASKQNRQYSDEFDEDLKKRKHSSNISDSNKKWSPTGGSEF